MTHLLLDIGFFSISIWDVLDILITGYLIYMVYRILRGSLAIPIFIGIILIYIIFWVVQLLNMSLLSLIFGQFVSVGVIMIIIVFQPEVRRFLLLLGNSTLRRREGSFIQRLFNTVKDSEDTDKHKDILAIKSAIMRMAGERTGALIVFPKDMNLYKIASTGIRLDSEISQSLILSIFNKKSPLHDGALLIHNGKIHSASCILPVSENQNLPQSAGLRHRSAVGVTENSSATAFIVSEETGKISYAREGKLIRDLAEKELYEAMKRYY